MEMKLEVVGREVIKPSSPSPQDLLQLSLSDVAGPAAYVSTIFFYRSVSGESREVISGRLKTSLSDALSRFYPLAGRMQGDKIICNDEGAFFTEARTDILLSDFLKNNLHNTNSLPEFLPTIAPGESAWTWPLLSVKVNFFGSGSGFAVTVSLSHRICDASSVLTFASGWAATSKAESNDVAMNIPTFASTTIYPPPPSSFQRSSMDGLYEIRSKCVINRFLFKSSKIAELKRRAMSETVPVPTRVEAIMSLMWRCATISTRSNSVVPKSTLMIQPMDLRLRVPSAVLPKDAVGNLQALFFLKKGSENEMEIAEIVDEFRKSKEGVNEMIKENLATTNTATTLGLNLLRRTRTLMSELKPDVDVYPMSSWCRKPFYEVDFGCGSPVWIGFTGHIRETTAFVLLIDSKDGEDVEAWISLPEQDMSVFVRDQEVLAYAVINPPILI
ncbi:BAHD acyltransferase BIA1 [Hirschfeldia incana]|nr:BAHD acyltransferase BIA1 [Hirschfeldia incana]